MTGLEGTVANLIQALLYALTTRLGAPGRTAGCWPAIGVGLAGGWVTAVTGGIAAAFLGHAAFASRSSSRPGMPASRCPGDARSRRSRDAPAARGLAGHRDAGVLLAGPVSAERPAGPTAPGRAVRPRPVLRLALPVLRLRGRRRLGGARAGNRLGALAARSGRSSTCGRTPSTQRSAPRARRSAGARHGLYRWRDAVAPAGRRDRGLLDASGAVRHRRWRRDHARGQPGPGRAG